MQIEFDISYDKLLLVKKAFTMQYLELPFTFIEQSPARSPLMVSVPHSGRHYPDELINSTNLNEKEMRGAEDFYVDELSTSAPSLGIDFLFANIARAYIDLNRSAQSLDSKLIEGIPNHQDDEMARAGQGVIPRLLPCNLSIIHKKLSYEEAMGRIRNYYEPYHNKLRENLNRLFDQYGKYLLIDMHSMPNSALGYNTADIIIGDYFSKSCNPRISSFAKDYFRDAGLNVRLNRPYAGGFTTQYYGQPKENKNVIQIEINRSLYMNETSLEKIEEFENVKAIITNFFAAIRKELETV